MSTEGDGPAATPKSAPQGPEKGSGTQANGAVTTDANAPAKPNAAEDLPSTVLPIDSAEERAALQQRYTQSRQELKVLLTRKKQADRDLAALESTLYKQETSYLEETQQAGNLVRGFDGYMKGLGNTRKQPFNEADRLFSLSSVSFSESAPGGSVAAGHVSLGGLGGLGPASTVIPNMPSLSRRESETPVAAGRIVGAGRGGGTATPSGGTATKRRKGAAAAAAAAAAASMAGGAGGRTDGESESDGSAAGGDTKRARVSYVG